MNLDSTPSAIRDRRNARCSLPGLSAVLMLLVGSGVLPCAAQTSGTETGTSPGRTIVVLSSADSGPSTLRQAIHDANASPGHDRIEFRIGSGHVTIRPVSLLPEVYDAATLDGTTQTGYAGLPLVEIDGSLAGDSVSGLTIAGSGSTIRGLAVNGFGSSGVKLRGGSGNRIVSCFLGIDPAGRTARGNLLGVLVDGGDGNTIGGTEPGDGNVISGNNCCGVNIRGAHGTTVIGNLIGTDATGTRAVANSGSGVVLFGGSGTTIGGTAPGAGNLISGNGTDPFADAIRLPAARVRPPIDMS